MTMAGPEPSVVDEKAVLACARRYCVRLPRTRPRGTDGERLGAGTGSSLEFQDYRGYAPGDDPRHIDWAAYARRDELLVRLYREEVAPRIDLVVDASRSMTSTPAKETRTRELLRLFHELGRADRLPLTLWVAGNGVLRHPRDTGERIRDLGFPDAAGLETVLLRPPALQRNGIRIVISDFLFPGEPAALVRVLARNAAVVGFLQVLDREEEEPSLAGGRRLTDLETGGRLDLVVTAGAREAYRRRLEAMRDAYRRELRRVGGRLAAVTAQVPLEDAVRGLLRESGILAVRGMERGI